MERERQIKGEELITLFIEKNIVALNLLTLHVCLVKNTSTKSVNNYVGIKKEHSACEINKNTNFFSTENRW